MAKWRGKSLWERQDSLSTPSAPTTSLPHLLPVHRKSDPPLNSYQHCSSCCLDVTCWCTDPLPDNPKCHTTTHHVVSKEKTSLQWRQTRHAPPMAKLAKPSRPRRMRHTQVRLLTDQTLFSQVVVLTGSGHDACLKGLIECTCRDRPTILIACEGMARHICRSALCTQAQKYRVHTVEEWGPRFYVGSRADLVRAVGKVVAVVVETHLDRPACTPWQLQSFVHHMCTHDIHVHVGRAAPFIKRPLLSCTVRPHIN